MRILFTPAPPMLLVALGVGVVVALGLLALLANAALLAMAACA